MTTRASFREEYDAKFRALRWTYLPRRFVMAHGMKAIYAALIAQVVFAVGYPLLGVQAFLTGQFNAAVAAWAGLGYLAFFLFVMLVTTSLHHYRMRDLMDEIDSTLHLHDAVRAALTNHELIAVDARLKADKGAIH